MLFVRVGGGGVSVCLPAIGYAGGGWGACMRGDARRRRLAVSNDRRVSQRKRACVVVVIRSGGGEVGRMDGSEFEKKKQRVDGVCRCSYDDIVCAAAGHRSEGSWASACAVSAEPALPLRDALGVNDEGERWRPDDESVRAGGCW